MDTTQEEQQDINSEREFWISGGVKGSYKEDEPISFNYLEESARAISQACILSYGIRFDTSAIGELYAIIEEGAINMKLLHHENDFSKIAEAQKNLVSFIQEIVTSTKEQKITTVDDKKVKEIREIQFCPVYPFT